jgi:PAS domain S-box-containing protein
MIQGITMSRHRYKILMIDSSAEDRSTFRHFLQKSEEFAYSFLEAELGAKGIETCLKELPDCVLLDYNLPDTDGLAVVKELNPDQQNPAFPVILLTGEGSENLAVKAIKSGAQDYLVKGKVSSEELVLAVANSIEIVSLRRKNRLATLALAESEERLNAILQNTNAVIYLMDEENRFVHVNRHFEELFNLKAAEVRGKSLHELFPKDFADVYVNNNRRVMETRQSVEVEETAPQSDGVHTYLSVKVPHLDADGNVRGVVGISTDITERKRAEVEIKALSDYNREVLESISDPFFNLDRNWQFTFISKQGEKMIFRPPGELLGKSIWDEFPGLDGSPFEKLYREAMDKGIVGTLTDYYPDHDRWYEVTIYPAPSGITVYFRDLTKRKRTELNLAFLADLSKDFAALSSVAEIMQIAGARIAEHLHLSRCVFVEIEEMSGGAVILHEQRTDDVPKLARNYSRAVFYTVAEMDRMTDGETVWINDVRDEPRPAEAAAQFEKLGIRALASAPFVTEGRWKFVLSAQHNQPHQWNENECELLGELSSRIWTRLERAHAEEALRESEEKFRALFDSIDEGFCIIEMIFDANDKPIDYRFVQANPAFERLTGLENALGKTMREFVPYIEEFRFEAYQRVVLTGEAVRFENYVEPMNRWFDIHASRVGDSANRRVAVVFNNITDRKFAELEREKQLEREKDLRRQAEDANRSKDEFLAVLSHELRTPLNSIKGWVSMLQNNDLNDEQQIQAVEVISRNVNLQNTLIEDILDVSRIISGKMRLETEKLSLISVLQNVLVAIRPSAEKKRINLETNLDPNADEVRGDAFRLQQIISNLLNNAVKFTDSKGTLKVILTRTDDTAKLTISDSGIGIAPELLPHIFDRFQQADSTSKRKYNGLGLGLAIVKHLTELHGGTVSAASAGEGKGASFIIELPLISKDIALFPEAVDSSSSVKNSVEIELLKNLKVLLVDDDADTLEMMRVALKSYGAIPVCANSANDALEKLAAGKFDLLISDVGMAGMDGYDLLRKIRQNLDLSAEVLPAIALSGYVSADDREKAITAGFQKHLGKPVNIESLPSSILTLLQ